MSTPKFIRVAGQVYRLASDLPPGTFSDPEDPYNPKDDEYLQGLSLAQTSLRAAIAQLRQCAAYVASKELYAVPNQLLAISKNIAKEYDRFVEALQTGKQP